MSRLLPEILFCLGLICCTACNQPNGEKPATTEVPADTTSSVNYPPPSPFSKLDAESLIGKYYNQQNQQAKYAYYKSVATRSIRIDTSYHKDTILLTVTSDGRIWKRPNQDTITSPFSEDIVMKVYRYHQIWWADKLQAPDAINTVQEAGKK